MEAAAEVVVRDDPGGDVAAAAGKILEVWPASALLLEEEEVAEKVEVDLERLNDTL